MVIRICRSFSVSSFALTPDQQPLGNSVDHVDRDGIAETAVSLRIA